MSILSALFKKSAAAPAVTVEEANAARERALVEELHALDAAKGELKAKALQFIRAHGILVNGIASWQAESAQERLQLEEEYQNLQRQADRILPKRNKVLAEWSPLKIAREQREKENANGTHATGNPAVAARH
ncbi:MAG TPA: hypothetical protein VNZ56_15765 [Verrucomicrobiae bacterium]|jgi:hypothetical protein|nr:hypothetical protein [Verrucomicrobiae bacterium]